MPGACFLGRLGAGLPYGEMEPLNARRGNSRWLVLPLAARVTLLLADLVGLVGRGVLPGNLAPLRLGVPPRRVPRPEAAAEIQGVISGKTGQSKTRRIALRTFCTAPIQ